MNVSDPIKLECHGCSARQSKLCSAMEGDDIQILDAAASRINVETGGYLFQEEDQTNYVYNVSSGMGMLERLSSDGRRQVMGFLYPGDYIGLTPYGAYSIGAVALSDMRVCRWNAKDLDRLFDSHPELEHRVRRIGAHVLAVTMDQVFVLGCKNAAEKLAYFILYMEKRQKEMEWFDGVIRLPMTRTDIADYLGVTVETVSRVFTRIRKEGLIELISANEVIIKDREGLEEAADHFE